jgi:hypothetical protein
VNPPITYCLQKSINATNTETPAEKEIKAVLFPEKKNNIIRRKIEISVEATKRIKLNRDDDL